MLILNIIIAFVWMAIYVKANVYVKPENASEFMRMYRAKEADFGDELPEAGILGVLDTAKPLNACTLVEPIYVKDIPYSNVFALIEESQSQGDCSYSMQVLNAQAAGYSAAIVYRNKWDDHLIQMKGDGPVIPSVYIRKYAGLELQKHYLYKTKSIIKIIPNPELPLQLYLIPFAVVVGVCLFFMFAFSLVRYCRFRLRQRRVRLSPANLKRIPTKKFCKATLGDEYDICAICIEEYEENEKIRILPCSHAYHCKCVDPWLTSGKKVCPVCKRSVEPEKKKKKKIQQTFDGASTSSQHTVTESEEEENEDERTPLLSSQDNVPRSGAISV